MANESINTLIISILEYMLAPSGHRLNTGKEGITFFFDGVKLRFTLE